VEGAEYDADRRVSGVGMAVEFAKSNNLLGIFVHEDTLVSFPISWFTRFLHNLSQMQVPSLISAIRSSSLLVCVHKISEQPSSLVISSEIEGSPVDAFGAPGRVVFIDHSMPNYT
jgi:CDK inhibitor PHO81